MERNVGNVTEDSELTFEYGIRRKQKVELEPIVVMETEPKMPIEMKPKIRADPELDPNMETAPEVTLPPAVPEPKLKELGATCEILSCSIVT